MIIVGIDAGSVRMGLVAILDRGPHERPLLLRRVVYSLADVRVIGTMTPADVLARALAAQCVGADAVCIEEGDRPWGSTLPMVSSVGKHLLAARDVTAPLMMLARAEGIVPERVLAATVRREVIPGVRSDDADAHVWGALEEIVEGWRDAPASEDTPALAGEALHDAADAGACAVWFARKLRGTLRPPKKAAAKKSAKGASAPPSTSPASPAPERVATQPRKAHRVAPAKGTAAEPADGYSTTATAPLPPWLDRGGAVVPMRPPPRRHG